jgi:hypothetical protein
MPSMEAFTPADDQIGFFLASYPDEIVKIGQRLRRLVLETAPGAQERLRGGWALIGYDIPLGKRTRYFAWIAPERKHIHLGFEYGAWMADPDRVLEGAHLKLKKVRYLTFEPGDKLNQRALRVLVREGIRSASLPREARLAMALEPGLSAERRAPAPRRAGIQG